MSERMAITEADKVHMKWYEEAKAQTSDSVGMFIRDLLQNYNHDYGTICHAVAAAALAGAHAIDHDKKQGGITGFQTGAVMWEFIRHWLGEDQPMRLLKFEELLYTHYERRYKTIPSEVWEWLQKEAATRLSDVRLSDPPDVLAHWQSIVDGIVPFGLSIEDRHGRKG